jgi:hypothetical protein
MRWEGVIPWLRSSFTIWFVLFCVSTGAALLIAARKIERGLRIRVGDAFVLGFLILTGVSFFGFIDAFFAGAMDRNFWDYFWDRIARQYVY